MKKILITGSLTLLFIARLFAQEITALPAKIDQTKTANTKDILTSFVQSGIDNLLGEKRNFKLSLSFLAIDSLINGDQAKGKVNRKSFFRNSSLNLNVFGDSSNHITKWSAGITLEIINKKDIKSNVVSGKDWAEVVASADDFHWIRESAILYLKNTVKNKLSIDTCLNDYQKEYLLDQVEMTANNSFKIAFDKKDFNLLSPQLQNTLSDPSFIVYLKKVHNSPTIDNAITNMKTGIHLPNVVFQRVAQEFSRKPLWIMKPTVSYDREHRQGEYLLESNFTTGFGSLERTPWEFEVSAKFLIGADSTITSANYKNRPLTFSVGVNKVLLENENKESRAEFKFFSQYSYKVGDYVGKRDEFSLNSTLRFNVYKAIWLPITIKYDPKNGNVFGFFSITANIGN